MKRRRMRCHECKELFDPDDLIDFDWDDEYTDEDGTEKVVHCSMRLCEDCYDLHTEPVDLVHYQINGEDWFV